LINRAKFLINFLQTYNRFANFFENFIVKDFNQKNETLTITGLETNEFEFKVPKNASAVGS
jgi:hypothetical protein